MSLPTFDAGAWSTRLFEPWPPLWRYCLACIPVALIPSVAIGAVATALMRALGADVEAYLSGGMPLDAVAMFGAVVIGPVVETLLLAGGIAVLSSFHLRPMRVAVVTALVWAVVHAMYGALWFFGVVWSFFVYACAYTAWRKVSFRHAFAAAAIPHAAVNLLVVSTVRLLSSA